jgi:hypothetical protein
MSYQSIILLATTVINLVLAIWIYKRNTEAPLNFYFSLMVLFGSFWNLGLFGYSLVLNNPVARLFLIQFIYICTLITSLYYFIFCYHFPYRTFVFSKKFLIGTYSFVFLYSLFLSLNPNSIVDSFSILNSNIEVINLKSYFIFAVIFFTFVISGLTILIKKYLKAEGVFRKQLRYVIFGTALTYFLASATNLLPYFWDSVGYYWLGPVFSLINAGAIAFLVFFSNFKIVRQ